MRHTKNIRNKNKKQKTNTQPENAQLKIPQTQQEITYIKNERNTWYSKLPQTKIEHVKEEENMTTKPDTTKTIYTSYRKEGVYEWSINTSDRITQRHLTPDYHIDEEFEW